MNDKLPQISVAMPVFNAERTVAQSINSILNQTETDWELIVIDDGSTDRTLDAISAFHDSRIVVVRDGLHKGLPARLNEAIKLSRGEYYARMDADDIAYPTRFEQQLCFMESHREVDLLGAWMLVFGSGGAVHGKRAVSQQMLHLPRLATSIPLPHPTFFGRTTWFRKHPYPEWATYSQDQYLLLSAHLHSTFAVLPEILLGYREEKLTFEKQFRSRISLFRSPRDMVLDLGTSRAIILFVSQAIKLGLDWLAITADLDYHLLRYRAIPVTREEQHKWAHVWNLTNAS
jgi:glycosyltransferase involved in cell wall biosynthesis